MLRMMEFYFGSRTRCETDCSKLQRRFWRLVWRCCFKVTGYIREAGCKYAWIWSTERWICFNLIGVRLDFRALGAHNGSNYKDTLMKQRLEPEVRSWILVSKKCRERENLYLPPVSPLSLLSFTSTGWFACGQAHNERLWELQGFTGILVLCTCVCVRDRFISVITLRAAAHQRPQRGSLQFFVWGWKCVFMISWSLMPCIWERLHLLFLHNRSGNLIMALCTISFFSVIVDVFFSRWGLANSCVCAGREQKQHLFTAENIWNLWVTIYIAAKFCFYSHLFDGSSFLI